MKKIVALLAMFWSFSVWAQTLSIVVPFPPGGAPDVWARILERHLGDAIKRPVVVMNRPGADGRLAMDHVATSTGSSTILLATTGSYLFNRVIYNRLNHTFEHFDAMVPMTRIPIVFSVNPTSPVRSFRDLAQLANQRPVNCAASSASSFFLGRYLMEQLQITNVTWVPFKGSADMNMQLMAGNIDCGFDPLSTHLPLHASGRLRILYSSGAAKHVQLPDVSLLRDIVPGLTFYNWYGIAIPRSFDPVERDRIFAALRSISNRPDYRDSVEKTNLELVDPPNDSTAWIRAEYTRWETIRQRLNIPKID